MLVIYAQLIEKLLPSLWNFIDYLYTLVGKIGQSTFFLKRKIKQTNTYITLKNYNDIGTPQSVVKLCRQTDIMKSDIHNYLNHIN